MPDFTIECHWRCATSTFSGNVGGYTQTYLPMSYGGYEWTCTCKSYKFHKGPEKTCKHIQEHEKTLCTWDAFFDGGEPIDGKCPRCGGPVEMQRIAV